MPQIPKVESKRRKKTVILLIVGAVVLLVVIGVVWWLQLQSRHNTPEAKVNDAITQSQKAYQQGDFTNALNIVNDIDKQAVSNAQKAQVYQAAAQAATSAGQWDQAIKYYELKHSADQASIAPDAYSLGTIYERVGQKDKALAQYRIALEYAKGQQNQYGSDTGGIQAAIDALEAKK